MKKVLLLLTLLTFGSAFVAQETVITGKLVGFDGKPMLKAHVSILKGMNVNPILSTEVSRDGSFKQEYLFRSGFAWDFDLYSTRLYA